MINKQTILFTISFRSIIFQPKLIDTLCVLVLLPLLIALGYWQLDRAEQKRQLLATYTALQQAKPITLDEAKSIANLQYYPIEITGQFDNSKNYLLDNRSYQHRLGFEVITPFIPNGGKPVLLVNRGWIARGKDRLTLPSIKPIVGEVTLQGMVYLPSKPFLLSQKTEYFAGWPRIIQSIEKVQLQNELNYNLAPFTVLLDSNSPLSYPRDWTPTVTLPSKHSGYAIQWFSFSLILLIIYLYINTSKRTY